jgi:hypothetical protein
MSLRSTPVSKFLGRPLRIFGFEVPDLLAICLFVAVANFVVTSGMGKIWFVWLPALILGLLVRFGKANKPENFLVHWVRYQLAPGAYCAAKLEVSERGTL